MNAVGMQRDVETLLHESGHAMHTFAMQKLPLSFQAICMEIAEVSSMSMELIALDKYDLFYKDAEDLRNAKEEILQ